MTVSRPTNLEFMPALLALLLGSACSDGDGTLYLAQAIERPTGAIDTLDWRYCGQDRQCASVSVPIDYDNPDDGSLELALKRIPAEASLPYQGVLLTNPGGPGASGLGFIDDIVELGIVNPFPDFDLLSFDPRGIGESMGANCELPPAAELLVERGELGFEAVLQRLTHASDECRERIGPLFDHLGSRNVTRDIDRIRAALELDQLNFYGASYGTRLAALYAEMFPSRARALLLDASLPPNPSVRGLYTGQLAGLESAQLDFFEVCPDSFDFCPEDPETILMSLLDELHDGPLEFGNSSLSELRLLALWTLLLPEPDAWAALALLLADFEDNQEFDLFKDLDTAADADIAGVSGESVVNTTVLCTDDANSKLSVEELEEMTDEFVAMSPSLGSAFSLAASSCGGWTARLDPIGEPNAPDAPPILVIGGESDARAPIEWSEQMAEALATASLLRANHYGHVALFRGFDCVDDAARDYFLNLDVPRSGSTCNQGSDFEFEPLLTDTIDRTTD